MKMFFSRVALAALAILFCNAFTTTSAAAVKIGDQEPAWKLTDLSGRPISGADFAGKVVVIDFWATWCPPCIGEIPGYVALQKKYADQGVVFVGLSVDQGGEDVVKKFVADHQVNYRIALADYDVVTAFGSVEAFPTTFIIDRQGKIAQMKVGGMPAADFEALLKSVVK